MSRIVPSVTRAVVNLRQSWLISTITIAIISICLFLVGGYFMAASNLEGLIETMKGQVRITVYLKDGFPEADVNAFQDTLSALEGVQSVTYTSKAAALDEFRAMLGAEEDLVGGLSENPLPASMSVNPQPAFRNAAGVRQILTGIGDHPLVDDVRYGREWLDRMEGILAFLNIGAIALGLILSLAAVFIISNTIKITVMARRDELEILRYVGATEGFIRMPFLIEGVLQGLAGAVISLGLLLILHSVVQSRFGPLIAGTFGIESLRFLPPVMLTGIVLGGMVLGGIGSMASVGRFSK